MSTILDLDEAWGNFCDGDYQINKVPSNNIDYIPVSSDSPKCSSLYISTKTKISYLSHNIDLNETFWKIPITPYHIQKCGIIKKQMKFNCLSKEELVDVRSNIDSSVYTDEYIINKIDNPIGRIKFRDVRKISIGLSKKDITSYRCKKKGAFYNCFAVIVRIKHNNSFKEIHVKVFNTGKLEIPGIKTDDVLKKTLDILVDILNPIIKLDENNVLNWDPSKGETVLINSNFSCNYFVNRDKLFELLKYKYRINSAYDSCSYPGIQCEFYYDTQSNIQTGKQPVTENKTRYVKMSFMIFRTGSVLIVGKCSDTILENIYIFIKNILETEYYVIGGPRIEQDSTKELRTKKLRKKFIAYT
jgi:TATA-box binding protein (TBP) (component of TFIID and TFIIIB)